MREAASTERGSADARPLVGQAHRRTRDGLLYGLLAFFWLEYIRIGDYVPGIYAIKLNTIVPLVVATLTFFGSTDRSHEQVVRAPDTKWFLFMVLLFGVQFFTADVRLYIFEALKVFVGYFIIYYVILRQVTTPRQIKIVLATLVLVHVVNLALHPGVVLDPEGRHTLGGSFLGDGNDFAWSTCVAIPFALLLSQLSTTRLRKAWWYGCLLVLVLAVIGTQSRGGSIALFAVVAYLAFVSRKKGAALAGVAIVIVLVAVFAPSAYFERMNSVKDWEQDGSAQGRILAWKSAYLMALDNPLTGVGAGHYGVKFGFEYKPLGYRGPYLNTHSIYFQMLAEFGLPGLIVLITLIVGNLVRNHQTIRSLRQAKEAMGGWQWRLMTAMQASLIGYIVAGAFLSGIFYPHLFVLTALMESARYMVRNAIGVSRKLQSAA